MPGRLVIVVTGDVVFEMIVCWPTGTLIDMATGPYHLALISPVDMAVRVPIWELKIVERMSLLWSCSGPSSSRRADFELASTLCYATKAIVVYCPLFCTADHSACDCQASV